MRSSVIGAAGVRSQGLKYVAAGTLGQPTPIGIGSAGDETLYAGFWGIYRIPTGTDETPPAYRTTLRQNYPNPFNPSTVIEYSLARAGRVEVAVFDVQGRRIATLVDGTKEPGAYCERWDGKNDRGHDIASGVYFCRLSTESGTLIRKMILLR